MDEAFARYGVGAVSLVMAGVSSTRPDGPRVGWAPVPDLVFELSLEKEFCNEDEDCPGSPWEAVPVEIMEEVPEVVPVAEKSPWAFAADCRRRLAAIARMMVRTRGFVDLWLVFMVRRPPEAAV